MWEYKMPPIVAVTANENLEKIPEWCPNVFDEVFKKPVNIMLLAKYF
jgi:hypothetical protein